MPLWEAVEALGRLQHTGDRRVQTLWCPAGGGRGRGTTPAGTMPGPLLRLRAEVRSRSRAGRARSGSRRTCWSQKNAKILLESVIRLLKEYRIDTVCANVLDSTFSDKALRTFLRQGILPNVGVDGIDVQQPSETYIGETEQLAFASRSDLL